MNIYNIYTIKKIFKFDSKKCFIQNQNQIKFKQKKN